MRRRQFIGLVGGAVTAWPRAAAREMQTDVDIGTSPSPGCCPRQRGDRVKRREFIRLLGSAAPTLPLAKRIRSSHKESNMSDPQRREFLAAAAGMASLATLSGAQPAVAGDPSFMNNVPDPLLSGKDLPTFKFALEKSEGKVIGNSYGKEATVTQLPISKGIAGVSMRIEPGAMRELHWHATAAEWAFILEGRVRTTVIDPAGLRRDQRLRPGRRLVLSPRSRSHAAVSRRQALSFHSDLRQRLLLRIRHVQHHRLGRPHPKAAAGEELRPARGGVRSVPQGRSVLCPRQAASRGAGGSAAGVEVAAGNAQISPARAAAAWHLSRAAASGGSIPAASRSPKRSPALCSISILARCASSIGIRTPTSGST